MLDENDLKQIGIVIDDRFKQAEDRIVERTTTAVVTQVGEFFDQNVLPAIDTLIEEKLETKLEEKLETKLEEKLRPLPDRDFIVRQTAEVKGDLVASLRKEDEKVDLHIQYNKENKGLTEEQYKALRALQVFPSIEL